MTTTNASPYLIRSSSSLAKETTPSYTYLHTTHNSIVCVLNTLQLLNSKAVEGGRGSSWAFKIVDKVSKLLLFATWQKEERNRMNRQMCNAFFVFSTAQLERETESEREREARQTLERRVQQLKILSRR